MNGLKTNLVMIAAAALVLLALLFARRELRRALARPTPAPAAARAAD